MLDLGCGEGKLLRALLKDKQFDEIVGMDVSHRALEIAQRAAPLDRLPPNAAGTDQAAPRLADVSGRAVGGFDAAAVVEVIEHLDPPRLAAFERVVFEFARPRTVVVTTPNGEYNVQFESAAGRAAPPQRPPLRVDARRVPGLGERHRRRASATASASCRSARRTPRSAPPTQMAVFARRG